MDTNKNVLKNSMPKDIGLLYDIYAPAIFAVITNIIADKIKAEDVLIKIFHSLSTEIDKYDH